MTADAALQRISSTRARVAAQIRSARRSRSRVCRASETVPSLRPNGTTRPCGPPSGKKRGIGASAGVTIGVAGRSAAAAARRWRRIAMPNATMPAPVSAKPALPPIAGPPSGKAAAAVAVSAPVAASAVNIRSFISSFALLGGVVNGAFRLFCPSHCKRRAGCRPVRNSAPPTARDARTWMRLSSSPTPECRTLSARPWPPLAGMLRFEKGSEAWL